MKKYLGAGLSFFAFLLLLSNAALAQPAAAASQMSLEQLRAEIFQSADAVPPPISGVGVPHPRRVDHCEELIPPCAFFICSCNHTCEPCGGVKRVICFTTCTCNNPGCT